MDEEIVYTGIPAPSLFLMMIGLEMLLNTLKKQKDYMKMETEMKLQENKKIFQVKNLKTFIKNV